MKGIFVIRSEKLTRDVSAPLKNLHPIQSGKIN